MLRELNVYLCIVFIAFVVLQSMLFPVQVYDNTGNVVNVNGKIVIKVWDASGNLRYEKEIPMHSLTENGVKFFAMVLTGDASTILTDINGNDVKVDTYPGSYPVFRNSKYRICLGYTGNPTNDIRSKYNLDGELVCFGTQTAWNVVDARISVVGSFVAEENYTINEVGLEFYGMQYDSYTSHWFLLAYDVLSSPLEITENDTVSIAYIFDFP